MYLFFQLKTHNSVFSEEHEEEGESPALSLLTALGVLSSITVVVALCSENLTGAIEEVSHKTGLGEMFLGLIVLPIAGNAAEHITAVFVAVKNKMDLAIGVALGSSIQVPPVTPAPSAAFHQHLPGFPHVGTFACIATTCWASNTW